MWAAENREGLPQIRLGWLLIEKLGLGSRQRAKGWLPVHKSLSPRELGTSNQEAGVSCTGGSLPLPSSSVRGERNRSVCSLWFPEVTS